MDENGNITANVGALASHLGLEGFDSAAAQARLVRETLEGGDPYLLILDDVDDLKGHRVLVWQNAYLELGPEFERLYSPGGSRRAREIRSSGGGGDGFVLGFL